LPRIGYVGKLAPSNLKPKKEPPCGGSNANAVWGNVSGGQL